jgi:hypothetical protein
MQHDDFEAEVDLVVREALRALPDDAADIEREQVAMAAGRSWMDALKDDPVRWEAFRDAAVLDDASEQLEAERRAKRDGENKTS